jgi:hypothetical protein
MDKAFLLLIFNTFIQPSGTLDLIIPSITAQTVKTYAYQVQTSVSRTKHSVQFNIPDIYYLELIIAAPEENKSTKKNQHKNQDIPHILFSILKESTTV